MTCVACDRAEVNPATGIYMSGCVGCEARALAHGPAAHARHGDPGALQAAMRKCWPDADTYARGRVAVWGWIKRLEAKETT